MKLSVKNARCVRIPKERVSNIVKCRRKLPWQLGPRTIIKSFEVDGKTITLGDTVQLTNPERLFKVFRILEHNGHYDLITQYLTKTSLFVLPLLSTVPRRADIGWNKYFENSYIRYGKEEGFFLSYLNINGVAGFESFLRHPDYEDIVAQDDHRMVIKLGLPVNNDIRHFLEGRYSKFSDNSKKKILKFHQSASREEYRRLQDVITKNPSRRKKLQESLDVHISPESELYDLPEIKAESYIPNFYDIK